MDGAVQHGVAGCGGVLRGQHGNIVGYVLQDRETSTIQSSKWIPCQWGSGEDGQLGIGTNEDKEWVCTVKALPSQRVRSVVAGSRNSLAICHDGK
ncbi:ultraviolet-B receptor UVR8-like protein, partial [Trifolium pratense]